MENKLRLQGFDPKTKTLTRCISHKMEVSCRISSSSACSSDILSTIWLHHQTTETAGLRGALGASLMFAFSTQRKQRKASDGETEHKRDGDIELHVS